MGLENQLSFGIRDYCTDAAIVFSSRREVPTFTAGIKLSRRQQVTAKYNPFNYSMLQKDTS